LWSVRIRTIFSEQQPESNQKKIKNKRTNYTYHEKETERIRELIGCKIIGKLNIAFLIIVF
jgi:hypothetical protein